MASASEAARVAAEQLRAARERARDRWLASRDTVERLKARNRDELARLRRPELARRRGGPQSADQPRQPRQMHLYDADEQEHQPQPPAPRPMRPQPRPSPSDDDWSQQTWLH